MCGWLSHHWRQPAHTAHIPLQCALRLCHQLGPLSSSCSSGPRGLAEGNHSPPPSLRYPWPSQGAQQGELCSARSHHRETAEQRVSGDPDAHPLRMWREQGQQVLHPAFHTPLPGREGPQAQPTQQETAHVTSSSREHRRETSGKPQQGPGRQRAGKSSVVESPP